MHHTFETYVSIRRNIYRETKPGQGTMARFDMGTYEGELLFEIEGHFEG